MSRPLGILLVGKLACRLPDEQVAAARRAVARAWADAQLRRTGLIP